MSLPLRPEHRATQAAVVLGLLAGACSPAEHSAGDLPSTPSAVVESPITVSAVDPNNSARGVALEVQVLGSQFEPGSRVSFERDGIPDSTIITDSVAFVSSGKLIAHIRIGVAAQVGGRDVVVSTLKGKRGVGTELFDILSRIEVGDGVALGVNNGGEVVGVVEVPDPEPQPDGPPQTVPQPVPTVPRPFYWSIKTGAQVILPLIPRSAGEGSVGYEPVATNWMAAAISDAGVIVGTDHDHPVRWTKGPGGKWQIEDLDPGYRGVATDVSETGAIVGYGWGQAASMSSDAIGKERPFCWTAERGLFEPRKTFDFTGLARVSNKLGDWTNWRLRVNSHGDAVGSAPDPTDDFREGLESIPIVIRCQSTDPRIERLPVTDRYSLGQATAIAEDGTIYGTLTDGINLIAVRWRPAGDSWVAPEVLPGEVGASIMTASEGGRLGGVFLSPSIQTRWLRTGFLADAQMGFVLVGKEDATESSAVREIVDRGPGTFFYAVGDTWRGSRRIASLWVSLGLPN